MVKPYIDINIFSLPLLVLLYVLKIEYMMPYIIIYVRLCGVSGPFA